MMFVYTCLAEDFIGWVWAFCGNHHSWLVLG